ncbi:MAG: alpha/beta hydrolase-fold protein [Lachnospiraceae bacterium]|nr:alpha/beta hydrolase-fold protein [Lachnospiraceae bacterium]
MMDDSVMQMEIAGKKIRVIGKEGVHPETMIYAISFEAKGPQAVEKCLKLGVSENELLMVEITGLRWDEELSPWPEALKDMHCTGEADACLKTLTENICPRVEEKLGYVPKKRILAGYSMAGLFSLYALYKTEVFNSIASVSGSLWYPKFKEYAMTTPFACHPEHIYLSLGDRESRTRHPLFRTTQSNYEELRDFYAGQNLDSIFELNSGNHFQDPAGRVAKGIAWLLRSGRQEEGILR